MASAQSSQPARGIGTFLLFGFLGGFILNLMPCVLPVISLKIFGFIQQAGQSRERIFRTGLAFTAGIFAWFLALALLLIGLRRPSQFVWWPALVLGTAAVLLIGNLLGAFASTLSNSPGEVMLYVVVPLLPLLYLSGVFTTLDQPALLLISRLLPFGYLHEAVLGTLGGQPNLLPWETLLGAFGFLVGAAGLTGRLGRRVLETD